MTDWNPTIESYDRYLRAQGRLQSTRSSYVSWLRRLAEVAPAGPSSVTPAVLVAWLDGLGPSRPNGLRVVRPFYGWAVRTGLVEVSPVSASTAGRRARSVAAREAEIPPLWRAPIAERLAQMRAQGCSPQTMRLHRYYLLRFARVHPDPWATTSAQLVAWVGSDGWSPSTRKSARNVVRRFYAGAGARHPDAQVTAGLLPVRVPRKLPRPTAQGAFEDALERADDKDRLMLLLAAYAGLRAREVAAVRPSTDVQDGFLYVTGKGGDERRIPLHPLLLVELEEEHARRAAGGHGTGFRWCGAVEVDGWLFPSQDGGHVTPGNVSHRLRTALPGRWSGHTLRHRFATSAYGVGRDLRAVQELLGHASPTTTAQYTLVSDADLRAAVAGIA